MSELDTGARLAELVEASGIRRVHLIAWRDLDDPTAGGSEIHINEIARRWTAAGLDLTLRTGRVPGGADVVTRDGMRVVRRGHPLDVWVRNPLAEIAGRDGPYDALVEVWHGLSFFAPVWTRKPVIGIFHHVHQHQFRQVLPAPLARVAEVLERRVYPRLYADRPLIALSDTVKADMVRTLGWRPDRVAVVEPGVAERFSPGGERSAVPLVVCVARLMPQKNVAAVVDAVVALRDRHPEIQAVIVGDGPERPALEAQVHQAGAGTWIHLVPRLESDELVELYRRAWVLATASRHEGWGMTVTEAGACETPSVASRIPGHDGAVVDGVTGFLATGQDGLVAHLDRVLSDAGLRARLGAAAREHAAGFRWDAVAARVFAVLADEARRRQKR